ncbi:hypothetical protein DBV05_g10115 [Lasiodiplodia theobromae]|uniref:RelA/SpoT domain-containing protein n=1 Tax=Lasiodiplodia theobromae TaxID=45133 RepID=A0A5N5D0N4_9PEZI|nr:hypothetical protein DBV05_g10115 [Lasiodiplodia theobromae]
MRGSERVRSTSDQERESEKVQKEFLEWWIRNDTQSQYKLLTKTATFRCESELQRSRIQAVVSSRVKNVDSLRTKLDQRVSKSEKIYRERKDIISDIVDLAGVRVALYMPSQMDVIDKLIRKKFHVFHTKEHGVGKRTEENEAKRGSTSTEYVPHFAGYRAKHYRVTLDGPNSSNRLEGPIEIQVISMLNHTWAQVSHDLVYKQMNGLPSEEEIRILDGLDGLIQVGETLLQQLHGVFQRRVEAQNIPFQSEYKLASFLVGKEMGLQSWLPSLLEKRGIPSEFHFGSMGPLLKLLKSAKRASPRDLEPYIGQLGKSSILDGPLHHFLAQARRPKLDLSILLMERVLLDANAADQLKQNATWTDDTVICRIKVLVGTLVLLDNLFPPFKEWAPKLFVDQNLRHSFDFGRNVQWLIHAEHLQAVVERREPPAQELNYHLEQPWTWFSTQPNGLIEFAFKVSSHVDFADFDRLSYFKQVLTQAPFQDESKMLHWKRL